MVRPCMCLGDFLVRPGRQMPGRALSHGTKRRIPRERVRKDTAGARPKGPLDLSGCTAVAVGKQRCIRRCCRERKRIRRCRRQCDFLRPAISWCHGVLVCMSRRVPR
eukprot:scaffold4894_cov16-Prasinocladus_malaysianus.AAC.1